MTRRIEAGDTIVEACGTIPEERLKALMPCVRAGDLQARNEILAANILFVIRISSGPMACFHGALRAFAAKYGLE